MKACVAICGEGGVGEFIVSRETRYEETMNKISSRGEFFTNTQRLRLNLATRIRRFSRFRSGESAGANLCLFFRLFGGKFFDRRKAL